VNEKVLHIFDHSLPLQSGYAFRSRSIIVEQRAQGRQTAHLTSSRHAASARRGSSLAQETIDGLVFHRTFPGWLGRLPALRQWDVVRTLAQRIVDVARSEAADLLHVHSPCLNGVAALQAARTLDLPVVYEVRAFWEDAAVEHGTASERGLRYGLTRRIETQVLNRVDQITCICEGLRGDIVARGIDPARVTVIPNAVDVEEFRPLSGRDPVLESQHDLRGGQVLGFIGSFHEYEGLDLLLGALPAIVRERPNVRVLLVGGGPQEAALRAQAKRLHVSDRVVFVGRIPHGRVPSYSSLVDAFVFPSRSMRLTELVTPLKPLEAMAQRRLVLASDVGGHRELIRHERTGLLFRHDDVGSLASCAIRALSVSALHDAMLERARAFVERERNWHASVRRYDGVYERALRHESPRALVGELDSAP